VNPPLTIPPPNLNPPLPILLLTLLPIRHLVVPSEGKIDDIFPLMCMSQEEEKERRCRYSRIGYDKCFPEGDNPPTAEECLDCMIEALAISIEDNKNVEAMHRLHILIDIIKDLKKTL
jgi:hypothetical protein